MALIDNFSKEEIIRIVKQSTTYLECLQKMGYNSNSGSATNRLRQVIQEYDIDISHFHQKFPIKRTEENIFVENSTATQKVLRRWYQKGNYTPYKCSICGQEPFWNGKPLIMILDHINGHNHDDRLENLRWVCPNCNYQLDTTNGKNQTRKEHKENYCKKCGARISLSSTYCQKCSNEDRKEVFIEQLNTLVTRDELKKLIRTTPFTKIGKSFNVTDNAIRKWCKKYNLPNRVSDIKKISDEDWEKI